VPFPSLRHFRSVFAKRDFRLLFAGQFTSLLGDQFYMIALPWLVLRLEGSSVALGGILALQALPRALLMLVGGAITDRLSPRRVMLASNLIRMMLVFSMGLLVFFDLIDVWMLYIAALALGVADAFFYPAQTAIVPQVTSRRHLGAANAVMQGSNQFTLLLGAVVAGAIIALFSPPGAELRGIGCALLIDALTFVASAVTLHLMSPQTGQRDRRAHPSLIRSIREGMRYVLGNATMRTLFLIVVAVNFTVLGPVTVGIPVLANSRLQGGAAGYGLIMSMFGLGSLIGILIGGATKRPAGKRAVTIITVSCYGFALGMAVLGLARNLFLVAALMVFLGIGAGYLVVLYVSWLQAKTPRRMIGRVMGLFSFATLGLVPVSQALTGALGRLSITWVFIGSGVLLFLVTFAGAASKSLLEIGYEPTPDEPHDNGLGQAPHRQGPTSGGT